MFDNMKLGELLEFLKDVSPTRLIKFDNGDSPSRPHSYRGYYEQLAFERNVVPMTVGGFLEMCQTKVLGKTFEGYKGGKYTMAAETPLWCSDYGDASGVAIVKIVTEGGELDDVILLTNQLD